MPTLHALPQQRKTPRADIKTPVEIQPDGASASRLKANSLNVSEGGMCLRLQEALEVKSRIRLRLFPDDTKKPVECAGQVAWVVQRMDLRDTPPFVYDVGIRFIDPPARLRQFFASRAGVSLTPPAERAKQAVVEPAMLNERRYMPHLDRETASGLWHLIVWVDGVPCFSHRYPTQREAIKAWDAFKTEMTHPAPRAAAQAAGRRRTVKRKKVARSR